MKTLLIICIFLIPISIIAQSEIGNFHSFFWHPNYYNASAHPTDSLILINSCYSSETSANTVYLNIIGGIVIPFPKKQFSIGMNYFSSNNYYKSTNDLSLFINKKFKIINKFSASFGLGMGTRYSGVNLIEDSFDFRGNFLSKGNHNESVFILNGGITFYWENIFLGISCSNCTRPIFYTDANPLFTENRFKKNYFILGYQFVTNRNLLFRMDAIARQVKYELIIDAAISSTIQNKYYFGVSMRNESPMDGAFHVGYKWQDFWFLGIYQPKNRQDGAILEMAAQLQISKNKK